MKAKDLMLGDFVTFKDSLECDNPPLKIEIIALGWQDGENNAIVRIGDDDICDVIEINDGVVGIPLTAEILEKNGWRKCNKNENSHVDGSYSWGDMGKRNFTNVTITFYKDLSGGVKLLTEIETDSSHEIGINTVHNCDIEYVHELQRALKLCGIDKNIEL